MTWEAWAKDAFDTAKLYAGNKPEVFLPWLVNYREQFADMGRQLDQAMIENERLKAIVSLIDLKKENDALKTRLGALTSTPSSKGGENG